MRYVGTVLVPRYLVSLYGLRILVVEVNLVVAFSSKEVASTPVHHAREHGIGGLMVIVLLRVMTIVVVMVVLVVKMDVMDEMVLVVGR